MEFVQYSEKVSCLFREPNWKNRAGSQIIEPANRLILSVLKSYLAF